MKDLSKPLRLAIFTALTGNTGGINMYDEKRKVSDTVKTFILFSTQQQTPTEENDCTWVSRCSIDIEIIQKTGSEVSKDGIDDISDTICQVLVPMPYQTGITSGNLQFTNAGIESIISRNLSISETESILQKVVRFAVTIIQQSN